VQTLVSIAGAVLDFAPPLVLAALGGVLSERAGVASIGLEGMMRVGAFFACWGAFAAGNAWVGAAAGVAAGLALAAIHGYACIRWRADQVISGIALNLVALGLVTFLLETVFGTTGSAPAEPLPPLPSWFGHGPLSYLALALPFALALLLRHTVLGLRLRAVGERPQAAASLGIAVGPIRWGAVLAGGALAGLGGAALPLAILHRFDNHMPSGMGFMALAAVVFGKWTPTGAFLAAMFFATAEAAVSAVQGALPHTWAELHLDGILLAAPYLLALAALAGFVGRTVPPAALGVPYQPEGRG
jgi:simple sugar transport system permease protein